MNIGDWVQRTKRTEGGRFTPEGREGKVHHVESIVAGEAVTACGNRMARDNDTGRLIPQVEPFQVDDVCLTCYNDVRLIRKPEVVGGVKPPAEVTVGEAGPETASKPAEGSAES